MATGASTISRAPRPSSLADVLDLILDKGLVIDAYVRVSLAGIELLTIDARVVVASVDTYLRFAEAVNRLDLTQTEQPGLTSLLGGEDGKDRSNGTGEEKSGRGGAPRGQQRADRGQQRQATTTRSRSSTSSEDEGRASLKTSTSQTEHGVLGRIAERARR